MLNSKTIGKLVYSIEEWRLSIANNSNGTPSQIQTHDLLTKLSKIDGNQTLSISLFETARAYFKLIKDNE